VPWTSAPFPVFWHTQTWHLRPVHRGGVWSSC